jgi:hypothetical protein
VVKSVSSQLQRALCVLSVCVVGCPGELGDLDRYLDASRADRPTASDVPILDMPLPPVDVPIGDVPGDTTTCPNIERDLFARRCGVDGCHASVDPVAGLDLASPNVAMRLVGVTSRCRAMPLVAQGNPEGSFLFLKVSLAQPACGRRMPSDTMPLNNTEIACVRAWVMSARRSTTAGM